MRLPILVLLVLGAACGGREAAQAPRDRRVPVRTVAAAREDLELVVRAVGTLRAERAIAVKPKRAGHVTALPLVEGEAVEAGAVLARLDDAEMRAAADVARASVRDADARIRNARRDFDRIRALHEAGLVSRQEFDDARVERERSEAALALATASLALAEAQLAETVVTAPFAGLLGQRRVDLGAYVREGDTLVSLVDADPLEIEFTVAERYVARVAVGSPVTVEVTSHPGEERRGDIVFVAPEVDPVNRTATVKARLANPDLVLRPGQFASVSLSLERRPGAVVVPEEALVSDGTRTLVYVVADGTATARVVAVGLRVPGRVEIRDGLAAGDVVVRTGHERLGRDGGTLVDTGEAS